MARPTLPVPIRFACCWSCLPARLVLLVVLLMATGSAFAQGFNTVNGRNHPELDWQVAETAHFEIMYPAHLAGIEVEAAPIAEASYGVLAENLGVTFDEKIRIYLSDEDEITNGFAVPIGNGYTDIWVHTNEVADVWTGREKWLRKVIAHELAHVFHYRAVRSNLGFFAYFFGDPLPRFWTEGLAQYETEVWDAYRGDRWLRTAVLDDQLSYNDGRSAWNGRLLYSVGNAQVRYFAEQYGDSTLAKLLAHRKNVLLGLGKTHDFYTAFKEVTDETYRDFYDRWRRHMNVYYNTLAGQMETPDSLGTDPLSLPGQYLYGIRYSPDTTQVAVVSLASLQRPVRQLYVVDREAKKVKAVAEGSIQAAVAWSPEGTRLAFARRTRGAHGSLLYDLYLVGADGKNQRRLTHSRRATFPTFSPDGQRLAFIGSEGGTANIYVMDLATGAETRLTDFSGDVQLAALRWHPSEEKLAFARFGADGVRGLVLFDLASGKTKPLTDGVADDRMPVWSPDGTQIAYTSLRDRVPNVFVYNRQTGTHRRVAHLATGTAAYDWLPPDSARATGSLVVISNPSKRRDHAYRIDAARAVEVIPPSVPAPYGSWLRHRPPQEVPSVIVPDASPIEKRYAYASFKNLTHASTFGFPYFNSADDWGISGITAWVEPLSKHQFLLFGSLSFPDPAGESFFSGSYINNQWLPTISLNAYRFPGSARSYGNEVLAERFTGGDIRAIWPLDWTDRPYVSTALGLRLRFADITPLNPSDFEQTIDNLPIPESGQQADVRFSLTARRQRPYIDNVVHPLDGLGVRLRVTGAARLFGTETDFLRGDLAAYGIVPSLGLHRLFLYGRLQAQTGSPLAQDVLGLSRLDQLQLNLTGYFPLRFGNADRVRGYRRYAIGNRVAFGTLEYRVPLLPDLQTRLLGIVSLGSTSLAAFTDVGFVWTEGAFDQAVERVGLGVEVKNAVRLGGVIEFMHALGLAQPADDLGNRDNYDLYYRIRAAVPF